MAELTTLNRFSTELENKALDKDALLKKQELANGIQKSEASDIYLNTLREEAANRVVYKMVFTSKDMNDALVYYDADDDVSFKMLPEDLYPNAAARNFAPERQLVPGAFINREITARVKEIDVENRIVYMVYASAAATARVQINEELSKLFNDAKKDGTTARVEKVAGVIMRVYPRYAIVNIVNKGVIGFVHISNWSDDYTRDMTYIMNPGDIYTVDIIDMTQRGVGRTFQLDHKPYSVSPWSMIPADVDLRNITIPVRCTIVDVGKRTWYGTVAEASTPLPKGMELFGRYKSGENAIIPQVGQVYLSTVAQYNRETKSIAIALYRAIRDTNVKIGKPVPVR